MAPLIEYRHVSTNANMIAKVLLLSMACGKTLIHKEGVE